MTIIRLLPMSTGGTWPAPADLIEMWRAAREQTALAYDAWSSGGVDARRDGYAVYLAAAHREQAAERAVLNAQRQSA